MALSPPSLTGSPSSSSNTYCSSGRSSLDYSPPSLVEQKYKLSSIYSSNRSCSLQHSLDSKPSVPPLNDMGQSEWSATCAIHPSSSASAMPTILSSEYHAFSSYGSALSSAYEQGIYQPHHTPAHSASASAPLEDEAATPSAPRSSSSTSVSYMPTSSAAESSTAKVKMETASDYSHAVEASLYPSPTSLHTVYNAHNPYTSDASTYASDTQHSWQKLDYRPVERDQFDYPAADHAQSALAQDTRRPCRAARPHKPSRRMTTKDEANYQCPVKGCGKLFSRSYNFKAHKETHDEKREYPFPCPVGECNKRFVRKTDLQRHHQSVHMKERSHKCNYCGRSFARKDTLRRYRSIFAYHGPSAHGHR